jgi:predicted metalloprotease with PDZ domain
MGTSDFDLILGSNSGPAAAGGVRSGDVITKIDGQKVASSDRLSLAIAKKQVGDRVTLEYLRVFASWDVSCDDRHACEQELNRRGRPRRLQLAAAVVSSSRGTL